MFSNSYQSGQFIELYNDTIKSWKFMGKITKEYDSTVKGYINLLHVPGVSKMQIPKDDKIPLGIVQSYIVFQLYIFTPKSLSIEIAISDTSKTKRRIMFSANSKEIVINPLHCRVPLGNLPVGVWINVSVDVLSFVAHCFKSQTFRSIDYISISANCKLRRIFSMRNPLSEITTKDEEFPMEYADILPRSMALPNNISQMNVNLNIEKLLDFGTEQLKISKEIKDNSVNSKLLAPNVKKEVRSKSQNKNVNGNNNVELLSKGEFINITPTNQNYVNPKDKSKLKSPLKLGKLQRKNLMKDNKHNEQILHKEHKEDKLLEENYMTDNKLLNTLNYKNEGKWEAEENESIEEIYEIEEKRSSLEEVGDKVKAFNQQRQEEMKDNDNENEEQFYYDIPIKDYKKTIYKDTEDNFKVTGGLKSDPDAKKKMIEEILKDSNNSLVMIDKERPYTPPFTKLVPMNSLKSLNRAAVIIEKAKEEILNSEVFVEGEGKISPLMDSLNLQQSVQLDDKNYLDLIYDHVLGCYYDPKTNMYYELKN